MGGRYQLLCGDFFAVPADVFASVEAVYDRASLIALPPDMRPRYALLLAERLMPGTQVLLITLSYQQQEMDGPPFSVPDDEVRALFADRFDITTQTQFDALADNDGLRKRGLTALTETVYLLKRKA